MLPTLAAGLSSLNKMGVPSTALPVMAKRSYKIGVSSSNCRFPSARFALPAIVNVAATPVPPGAMVPLLALVKPTPPTESVEAPVIQPLLVRALVKVNVPVCALNVPP